MLFNSRRVRILVRRKHLGRLVQEILDQHWQRLARACSTEPLQSVNHFNPIEDKFPGAKVIARLPSTVTLPYEGGRRYEFAVPEKELRFFDRTSGLRTAPRPV